MSIQILYLENFLANGSFLALFITTFYYWIQLGFFTTSSPMAISIGNIGLLISNLQLFGFFILRWIESHHFPLSNLYESLLFLTWSLILGHFLLPTKIGSNLWIGAITAPSALFVNAFASLTLSENLKSATPLVPALQSNWLMMHVTMMIISYSLLILGSLFSIAIVFLSFPWEGFTNVILNHSSTQISLTEKQPSFQPNSTQVPFIHILDNLSYRTLGFGFPIVTIGILSGAV